MNIVTKSVLGVIALIVIAVVALPFLISEEAIFNKVTQTVEETTGRKLIIDGERSLTLFPALSVKLNGARLSNIAGGSRSDMVKVEEIEIQIPYLSALTGNVSLDKFVIKNPDILLEKMQDGQVNWQLLPSAGEKPTETTTQAGQPQGLPSGFDLNLGEVAIYGGKLNYVDHQTNETVTMSGFDLSVVLPSLDKALKINGKLEYQAQQFEVNTSIDTPAKLLNGKNFSLEMLLSSALFNLDYQGSIEDNLTRIKGKLSLKGDSVKQILKWHGQPLTAKKEAFNQFLVQSDIEFYNKQLQLSSMRFTLDALDVNGVATIDLTSKLTLNADVNLGMLDLNPYLPEPKKSEKVSAEKSKDVAQPIVWDDTAIDLSALSLVNTDIKVSASGLKARNITLGESQLTMQLNDSVARLTLAKFSAYEGTGRGNINVNATSLPYAITTEFNFSGIQAKPLLSDVAGFEKLMGKGQFDWRFNTFGNSQKSFINALKGNLGFGLSDGAVQGANLASMVRAVKSVLEKGVNKEGLSKGFDEAESTDFSELTGSFSFVDGVSTTNSLTMKSPLLRVTGQGKVDLPQAELNYRLVTGIVTSIEGQGTQDKSTGFKIPVRINGPFHQVSIKPDLGDAAKEKAKDTIKDKLKNKLKDLF